MQITLDLGFPHGFSLRLGIFALDDAPPFDALLYTWSPPQFSKNPADDLKTRIFEVDCEGKTLSVGENLFDFLCHLRDGGFYTSTSAYHGALQDTKGSILTEFNALSMLEKSPHIWIDAICIDQENLQERSY